MWARVPSPLDGGGSTLVQARVATRPQLVTGMREFTPPVERSPIIYQIVLDLEIPVPDRCADVIQKIESLTQKYLTGEAYPVPVYKLPTINLAENPSSKCAQTNERLLQTAELAQAAKELVTTLPGVHQQIHFLYFNNLDAPLPMQLTTSLQTLFTALGRSPPNYQMDLYTWLFGPPGAALPMDTVSWWAFWIWETADESFEMKLDLYQDENLPRTSQEHDRNEPVPLLSPEEIATYEGKFVKICEASHGAQPFGQLPYPHNIFEPSWTITAADPPSYLVQLKEHRVVRAIDFVEQSSIVRYQICTRCCDGHGYVNSAHEGRDSWIDSFDCGGPVTDAHAVRHRRRTRAGRRPRRPRRRRRRRRPGDDAGAGRHRIGGPGDGIGGCKGPADHGVHRDPARADAAAAATPAAATAPAPAPRPAPVVKPTVAKSQPPAGVLREPAPRPVTDVRVQSRFAVKAKTAQLFGAAEYLSRGDFYNSPGARVGAAYYPVESIGLELQIAHYWSSLNAEGERIKKVFGLLPDSHAPAWMFLLGGRYSIGYGKLMLGGLGGAIHFEPQAFIHAGLHAHDGDVGPSADAGLGLLVFLTPKVFARIDAAIVYEREDRSGGPVNVWGTVPSLGVGGTL